MSKIRNITISQEEEIEAKLQKLYRNDLTDFSRLKLHRDMLLDIFKGDIKNSEIEKIPNSFHDVYIYLKDRPKKMKSSARDTQCWNYSYILCRNVHGYRRPIIFLPFKNLFEMKYKSSPAKPWRRKWTWINCVTNSSTRVLLVESNLLYGNFNFASSNFLILKNTCSYNFSVFYNNK